jgi:hypothetical protein
VRRVLDAVDLGDRTRAIALTDEGLFPSKVPIGDTERAAQNDAAQDAPVGRS